MVGPRVSGIGFANGSFGELLQGALPGQENHFLITLPIHRFSRVSFTQRPEHRRLEVTPGHKRKSVRLARLLLRHLGLAERGHLDVRSELPEGKGMASSSADLVATARAVYAALGRTVDEKTLLRLLRTVEPTDGVMYPEFVAFFHRRVRLHRRLGMPARRLNVLAVDEGGSVDTVAYNRRSAGYSEEDCAIYRTLLSEICDAFARSDLRAIGKIATRSAELNQERLPKGQLELVRKLQRASDALGVVVTHSGPCVGLLYDDAAKHRRAIARTARALEAQGHEVFYLPGLDPRRAPRPACRSPTTSRAGRVALRRGSPA